MYIFSIKSTLFSLKSNLDEVDRNSEDKLSCSSNTASREQVGVAGCGGGGGEGAQCEVVDTKEQ